MPKVAPAFPASEHYQPTNDSSDQSVSSVASTVDFNGRTVRHDSSPSRIRKLSDEESNGARKAFLSYAATSATRIFSKPGSIARILQLFDLGDADFGSFDVDGAYQFDTNSVRDALNRFLNSLSPRDVDSFERKVNSLSWILDAKACWHAVGEALAKGPTRREAEGDVSDRNEFDDFNKFADEILVCHPAGERTSVASKIDPELAKKVDLFRWQVNFFKVMDLDPHHNLEKWTWLIDEFAEHLHLRTEADQQSILEQWRHLEETMRSNFANDFQYEEELDHGIKAIFQHIAEHLNPTIARVHTLTREDRGAVEALGRLIVDLPPHQWNRLHRRMPYELGWYRLGRLLEQLSVRLPEHESYKTEVNAILASILDETDATTRAQLAVARRVHTIDAKEISEQFCGIYHHASLLYECFYGVGGPYKDNFFSTLDFVLFDLASTLLFPDTIEQGDQDHRAQVTTLLETWRELDAQCKMDIQAADNGQVVELSQVAEEEITDRVTWPFGFAIGIGPSREQVTKDYIKEKIVSAAIEGKVLALQKFVDSMIEALEERQFES
jgi:hypothetical protein